MKIKPYLVSAAALAAFVVTGCSTPNYKKGGAAMTPRSRVAIMPASRGVFSHSGTYENEFLQPPYTQRAREKPKTLEIPYGSLAGIKLPPTMPLPYNQKK
ncbi:MAG: hypothetical protein ACI8Y7_000454 [Candidatus Woesearchaeota archaeon]|jgi:hypothetical protein